MIDLDKILALEAKATPGPWALVVESAPLTLYLNDNFVQAERKEDIDLISAMRNSIKELCAELRAAREVVAYFREWNGHSDVCDIYQDNLPCDCGYSEDLEVLKKYDEARQG